jgi:hypothetical protein
MEAIVAKIDLDVAFEVGPALDAYLERLLADTKVTATVINERGSGGGWPEVRFEGPRDHLFYVAAYHAGPDGDPKFVTTLIQD